MFTKTTAFSVLLSTALALQVNAHDLDTIRAKGALVVATEPAFPPFEFLQDGEVVGFGRDLLDHVQKDLDLEVKQVDRSFQDLFSGLDAQEYDLIATSVVITPEREENFAFTKPFAAIEIQVLVDANNQNINSIDDLSGMTVATQEGSATEPVAQEIAEYLSKDGAEFAELVLTPTYGAAASLLKENKVDAVLMGGLTAKEFMHDNPDEFRVSFTYGDPVYLAWVAPQDSSELLAEINATIVRLADSGELSEMQEYWIGESFDIN